MDAGRSTRSSSSKVAKNATQAIFPITRENSLFLDAIFDNSIPTCDSCNSLVKPDIVFFGEALPDRFHRLASRDLPECDLLIIMGTSLTVHPFAGLVDM